MILLFASIGLSVFASTFLLVGMGKRLGRVAVVGLLIGVLALSVGLYGYLGTPNTERAINQALEKAQKQNADNPNDLQAILSAARLQMQLRDFKQAKATFELALETSRNAPAVQQEYMGAMQYAGIDITPISSSAEQAIMALPENEQKQVIMAMVERLQTRLDENGGTAEEWAMLARSYAVIGETEKAKEIKNRIEAGALD